MAKQLAFYLDSGSCTGCKACQAACKDKHDHDVGILWRRVYEITGGSWTRKNGIWETDVFAYNLSIACNHCLQAPCLAACPTGAISKGKDGIVEIQEDLCMGCRYCEWACPYGAPQYDYDSGKMTKCDFCRDYIEEERNPACVAACPMRALDFGELEDLKGKYGDTAHVFPLPPKQTAQPALVINPHRDSLKAKKSNARIANREEIKYVE